MLEKVSLARRRDTRRPARVCGVGFYRRPVRAFSVICIRISGSARAWGVVSEAYSSLQRLRSAPLSESEPLGPRRSVRQSHALGSDMPKLHER